MWDLDVDSDSNMDPDSDFARVTGGESNLKNCEDRDSDELEEKGFAGESGGH